MFLKEMLWKLTMYGKVFNFPTHLGKRKILAFPFSTISTAETTTTFLYSKGGHFYLSLEAYFMGRTANLKGVGEKPKDLIGRHPAHQKIIMQKLKHTNRCASALSQKGFGQDFINLEPQTCYRWFFHRIVWIRQGTDSFLGRQRRQGHRGAHPLCSPHNALIQMSD